MTSPGRIRSAAGFTLLELLVALAVLGLLLDVLGLGMRFGMSVSSRVIRSSDISADLEAVDNVLRRLIEGMDPGHGRDPAPFVGATHRLDFITAMPDDGLAQEHRMRVGVFVDSAHRLILRWRPYLRALPLRALPPPSETELLSNVERIDLAFWQPGGGWSTAWRSSELPVLIRVRLTFPFGDPRHWPDIVAAPLLDRP